MIESFSRREWAAGLAAAAALHAQSGPLPGIGVIGLGNRSKAHFGALAKLPEARVVSLSDVESARIQEVNSRLPAEATAYTDYRELLKDKNTGIVVIATPNFMHREMAIAALRAGKDVMLEKPIAINYAQAREIQRVAQQTGRILGIGMQRSYRSDVELVETIRQGAIGNVKLIACGEFRRDWFPGGWMYEDPRTGKRANWRFMKNAIGSPELEFSVHLYGTLAQIVNSPLVWLSATGGALHYTGRDIRDASTTIVEFANGVRLNHTYCMFAPQPAFVSVLGDKGSLRREGDKLTVYSPDGKTVPAPAIDRPAEDDEVLMYRDFFDAVKTRRQPKVDAALAIEASKIAFGQEIAIAEKRIVIAKDFA